MREHGIPRRDNGERRRIDLGGEETLRGLYIEQGMNIQEIAEKLDVSYATVQERMEEHGIPRRSRGKYKRADLGGEEHLRELYIEQEMTSTEIGEDFGVSKKTVLNRMEEYGIQRRNSGESRKKNLGGEEHLRELYIKQEMSMPEIAEKFDVSASTVQERMDEYGIPRRYKNGDETTQLFIDPFELDDLYWSEGMTVKEVAEEMGVSKKLIQNRMDEYEIPTRANSVRTP
jgi:transposase